jgi:hypothetical protein
MDLKLKILLIIKSLLPTFLDPDLEIINGGRLKTKVYDKGNDFNLPIVKLPLH